MTAPIHVWRDDAHKVRAMGQYYRTVFTNGCFDLFHPGHLHVISEASRIARSENALLVVGINSDKSVKALKGESRPIWDERGRSTMVAAQVGVDAVVVFDELTPYDIIQQLSPISVVKGGDYSPDDVLSLSSRVDIVPLKPGWSTTMTIEVIRGR